MPVFFGVPFRKDYNEFQAHMYAFANWDLVSAAGATTERYNHFWWIVGQLFGPHSRKPFHDNPWAEKMSIEACENNILSVSGCASSGKTTFFALWGLINWFCSPDDTKVIVTSTSIKGARNRIWGQICEFHRSATLLQNGKPVVMPLTGKLVDSVGIIRLDMAKDGRTASQMSTIELIAAEQSQEKEAVDKLIGIKNKRVIIILDEATDLSPSVLSASFGNLSANEKFQIIALGNFKSITDTFGLISTPKDGWNSVNVDTQEWVTEYNGQVGKCIRFDGTQSPNVLAGKNIWPGLYSVEKHEQDLRMGVNTVEYWRFCRSFVVPSNVSDRVYSESDFIAGKCFERATWKSEPTPFSSLDPSFTSGGDKSVATFGLHGECDDGVFRTAIVSQVELKADVTQGGVPFDFQIASQWRDLCKERGISPMNAGFDATGAGVSFGSIVAQVWSPQVMGVVFGGAPSIRPVSETDFRPAKEAYYNRVAEIWFQGKEFVRSGQIRGLTNAIASELVERKRLVDKSDRKAAVERKQDMKIRMGKSPDASDSFLILLDIIRERTGWTAGSYGPGLKHRKTDNSDFSQLADEVYSDDAWLQEDTTSGVVAAA